MKKLEAFFAKFNVFIEGIIYILLCVTIFSIFIFVLNLLNDLHILVEKFSELGVYFPTPVL